MKKIIILLFITGLTLSLRGQNNVEDFSFYPLFTDSILVTQDTLLNVEIVLNIPDTNVIEYINYYLKDVYTDSLVVNSELFYKSENVDNDTIRYSRNYNRTKILLKALDYSYYQVSIRLKDVNHNYTEFKTK